VHGIIRYAGFVLARIQVLGRSLSKSSLWSYSIDCLLADYLGLPGKVFFRPSEVAFSSAFAKAATSDLLVDMPDPTTFVESWRSLASHINSPIG
jgi:hypothetical protein